MKKRSKFALALAGLAVLCVCAAMAAPMGAGNGAGRGGMMNDGNGAQVALEKMQANGVDTTALEIALENGDREAVRAFLQENCPADAPAMNEDRPAKNEGRSSMNGYRMQEMITKMQANGVDTTALENGDRETVRAFLLENCPADAPVMNKDRPAKNEGRSSMNGYRMQEMITKMQANGVDTTALENGDRDRDREAVRAILQENRPAGSGTGLRYGGPSP